MGRSSANQAAENHARIVAVSADLFTQHGVDAVSISDVMSAAGMTQGGFYKHFPSKDALAAEACRFAFERALKVWREQTAQSGSGNDAGLASLIAYYFSPKPPKWSCPMVAFGQDVASRVADDPVRLTYAQGVRDLLSLFRAAGDTTGDSGISQDQELLLFAAMVGANFLSRAVGEEGWIEEMKTIVLGAARTA